MANYVRLVALLGQARVKDIVFTARLMEAEEARAIGLLSEVLPDYAICRAARTNSREPWPPTRP